MSNIFDKAARAVAEYLTENIGNFGETVTVYESDVEPILRRHFGPYVEAVEECHNLLLLSRQEDEGYLDRYERVAKAYHRETGKMAPGKDVPAAAPELASTAKDYDRWWREKLLGAMRAVAIARNAQNKGEGK